ncbi:Retrovirus-related Pol polyprotein from transposon TNT 1-94 [Vitis vinifera]|uniref:Retrovirus-related Pol polyprotein from transposon TNT 1-94 n=1 Tax=Vitis vinifera TaxID=29760 RepID=A0A438KMU6_VITVI|nr:Retrovirus-related Pol polyprotein from transposon TNT 1-94 [Vitis vinifera]
MSMGCKWVFILKCRVDGSINESGIASTTVGCKKCVPKWDLEKKVYMNFLSGFDKENEDSKVCRLRKPLYALKQSPRAWFDRFTKALCDKEYKQAQSNHTLFYKQRGEKVTILIVYANDIILIGDDKDKMERLKKKLVIEFKMKDLGTKLIDTNGSKFKTERTVQWKPDGQRKISKLNGQTYLFISYKARYYLCSNPGKGLFFGKSKERGIEVFIDADEVVLVNDKRSTSSYSTLVLGNLVTWRSKKQTAVARSGVEAKVRVIAHGIANYYG